MEEFTGARSLADHSTGPQVAPGREPEGLAAPFKKGRRQVDHGPLRALVENAARLPIEDGPAFATSVIRKAIITGILKPGDAIRQDLMASVLSLSKPPVREALRTLEAEHLVVFLPKRGFVVSPETFSELREAWELRTVLEPAVLRLAAQALTPGDFEQARRLMGLLAADREYLRHFELNLEFHLILYRPSQRPHFLETIERAHGRCQRYSYRKLLQAGLAKKVPDDQRHEAIVDQLEAGDIDGACACLMLHLKEAAAALLNGYWSDIDVRSLEQTGRLRRTRNPGNSVQASNS